jgi:carbamoyl-phosphate synthase large subunit
MVIGSGPIVIGQAAEFDYAGTQACAALREEGIKVVLHNSNPATIMTDTGVADRVYLEPLDCQYAEAIIARERPQGLLATLGGQTGLNLAVELAKKGVLERYGVSLLGTPLDAIVRGEDREAFRDTMRDLGQPVPPSEICTSVEAVLDAAACIGFPVVVRPAYTLGGTGGGLARDPQELRRLAARGLRASPTRQVLVERSLVGHKEIEYEIMRDGKGNCVAVCNMENLDPMGVHTGDSIVVAPSQTLSDGEYQMLRSAAFAIISGLGIEGGCNVQFALNPHGSDYHVIEVNPRVSRSSALASKATGYPIAKVATKIAIGYALDEIPNPVTGTTCAGFEPALDYVVLKIPRWPFDKFPTADRTLGTQMKATGEVMAIARAFEPALLKALRSLEGSGADLFHPDEASWTTQGILKRIEVADDERLWLLAAAFRRGLGVDEVSRRTGIDPFFLWKIWRITMAEAKISRGLPDPETLLEAKRLGFSDATLARLAGLTETSIRLLRENLQLRPVYKMVDTCAAEFEAVTPYFYSAYETEDEAQDPEGGSVLVLGSGPIRIGQGIEFDYCSVHAVWSLQRQGIRAVIINNNPETVSTDYNVADRLYFEPLTVEDILAVCRKERPRGVIVQCGGQTAINLAAPLDQAGIRILGTPVEHVDLAEDRERFHSLLQELEVPTPPGGTGRSPGEALAIAEKIGYPVVVRPSYVLGGRAMEIVRGPGELAGYMGRAARVSPHHPVLVDRYIPGLEVEVDAIGDGEDVLVIGVMEHLERAGVHSGDSIAVYPAQRLPSVHMDTILHYTKVICSALSILGFINLQFVVYSGVVYVLEANPRASRTVPFLSKATGLKAVDVAVRVMLGETLRDQGLSPGVWPSPGDVYVKAPVFSFAKLGRVDPHVGPEMKSTGEVMGRGKDFPTALFKALLGANVGLEPGGSVFAAMAGKDKGDAIRILEGFSSLGFRVKAAGNTAMALRSAGVQFEELRKEGEEPGSVLHCISQGSIDLAIITPTKGMNHETHGYRWRRAAAEMGIPCLTSLDTARGLLDAVKGVQTGLHKDAITPILMSK